MDNEEKHEQNTSMEFQQNKNQVPKEKKMTTAAFNSSTSMELKIVAYCSGNKTQNK